MERIKSGGGKMAEGKKATADRRAGYDRRKAYKLRYFINGGEEKRKENERRS